MKLTSFIPTKGISNAVALDESNFSELFKGNQILASLGNALNVKVTLYKSAKGYWNLTGETLDAIIDKLTA